MVFGFLPAQTGLLVVLFAKAGTGPGLAVMAVGVVLGLTVVKLRVLSERRQLDRIAPADRLFGCVADVWPSGMAGHRFVADLEPPAASASDSPVDTVVWVDRSGVHWRPRKAGPVRASDLRPEEIDVARLTPLGWRNVGLELVLENGDRAALRVNDRGTLRPALDALDVRVDAVG